MTKAHNLAFAALNRDSMIGIETWCALIHAWTLCGYFGSNQTWTAKRVSRALSTEVVWC